MTDLFEQLTAAAPAFERRAADDLPAIAVNMVASVDGATTLDGRVGRLTGPSDQALLRRLREESDAVLVGAATVRAEGYSTLLRHRLASAGSPRAVPRSRCCAWSAATRASVQGHPLRAAPGPLVFLTSEDAPLPAAEREVLALRAPEKSSGEPITLRPLLARLRAEQGVERVVCEGGSTLNAALLAEGVVGELFVAISPLIAREPGSPPLVAGVTAPLDLELVAHAAAESFVFLRYAIA